jgi:hypothetical protein
LICQPDTLKWRGKKKRKKEIEIERKRKSTMQKPQAITHRNVVAVNLFFDVTEPASNSVNKHRGLVQ